MLDQMTQALDNSSDANAGSPEQLMDILLGQLRIPADKVRLQGSAGFLLR